jgi:transketolase
MVKCAGEGHIGSPMSIVEILVALYFAVLKVRPENPEWADRDRFVLSKGHGCGALYAVLARRGFFPTAWLSTFLQHDTVLPGHPDRQRLPGLDASTGSLGHGLSLAVGMAMAARIDRRPFRVYTVLGDGELNEGMIWEAALAASHFDLGNLVAIIDHNGVQIDGPTSAVMSTDPLDDKWRSFGWRTIAVDGHDVEALRDTMASINTAAARPTVILAATRKAHGVSFMEACGLDWHYRSPTEDEFERAFAELAAT